MPADDTTSTISSPERAPQVAEVVPAGICGPEIVPAAPLGIAQHDELFTLRAVRGARLVHDIQESLSSITLSHAAKILPVAMAASVVGGSGPARAPGRSKRVERGPDASPT